MTTEQIEDPEGRALVEAIHERKRQGRPGDLAGYVVLEQDKWGGWMETSSGLLDTIGQAVGQLRHYQGIAPQRTFAAARVHLSMISRPE